MHGPKSKFIMKAVQVSKQEEFSKGGRSLKLKKIGEDEGTILKHKIKAREKNRLTNKASLNIQVENISLHYIS